MYFCAGYYLIIPKHERGTVNGHTYTSRTWSVSRYISYVYPDAEWGLRWWYSKRQFAKIKNFRPDEPTLEALHTWTEQEYEQGNYGYPGFFTSQAKALEFKKLFLSSLPQIQLLGLFLDESFYPAALEQTQAYPSVTLDLHRLLQRRLPEPDAGTVIGYDLLGLLDHGGYEPSSYNVLEQEYQDQFGIALNEYGLFLNQADCQRVAAYTDQVAGEPAVWLPFRVKLFA
ncbi:hypothetical protein [Hymenobacter jeollabukensis]|uniref:Uncharacterized protein n=1 Tax=Hymenobacter jeollabukensis TaxID=2025313 RepID=A0A5R8WR31_9BACT|nr:hypothetical protein [Hymenobacter jeollabukensis]TLM92990.1 hypothetical protein FDY95_10150 [Hymenobacter jeollabukensis]